MEKEIAKEIEWSLPWDSGVYAPSVISDGDKLLLVYGTREIHPSYNKSTMKIIGDAQSDGFMAIIEFLGWVDFKFGMLDEETISSPHYIEGLQPYQAYEVQNSQWLENLKLLLSPKRKWDNYRHFVLGFHDTRFECIAKSYSIEAYGSKNEKVFEIAYDRITGAEWWMKGSKSDFRCPHCTKYLGKHVYANFCMHCGNQLTS